MAPNGDDGKGDPQEIIDIQDFDKPQYGPHEQARPDIVRKDIALRLTWLIVGLSTALILGVGLKCLSLDDAKDLAGTVIAPIIAVYGTIVGFFFGSSAR